MGYERVEVASQLRDLLPKGSAHNSGDSRRPGFARSRPVNRYGVSGAPASAVIIHIEIMARPGDRTAFLTANETRLKIAEWCSKEALSRAEIAKRLNRPAGAVSAPDTMLRRKALVRVGTSVGQPGRRPERLRLNPSWKTALNQALRRRMPTHLAPGTDLLLIQLASAQDACRVLAEGPPDVAWGAQLHGEQLGLLIAPTPDASGASTVRVSAALADVGVAAVRLRLEELMSPAELRSWATGIAAPPAGLPDGRS